jgi:hypothetical protein
MSTRTPGRAALAAALAAAALTASLVGATPANAAGFRPLPASTIPADYLARYRASARTCPGLRWEALAAVGRVESDHGRSRMPGVRSGENASGAAGPMQFIASTWRRWGSADVNDRYDPDLAVLAAARYLCSLGIGRDEQRALSSYYAGPAAKGSARARGDAYAARVQRQADTYAQTSGGASARSTGGSTGTRATTPTTKPSTKATTKPTTKPSAKATTKPATVPSVRVGAARSG